MKRYKVEKRTADNNKLWDSSDFETLYDAIEYVNNERLVDFKYGECDDYEYLIIDRNKQGGTKQ